MAEVKNFGDLKGSDAIQLLNTLMEEGAFQSETHLYLFSATKTDTGVSAECLLAKNHLLKGSSSDFQFKIGKFLVQKNHLNSNGYQSLKQSRKELTPAPPLGQTLLEKKLVSLSDLISVTSQTAELTFYETLSWSKANFKLKTLENEPLIKHLSFEASPQDFIPLESFLLDADKNMPVLSLILDRLNNPHTLLKRVKDVNASELAPHQYEIYQLVNNRNSLRDVLFLSEQNYFDTLAAIFQLIGWEMIATGGHERSSLKPATKPTQNITHEKTLKPAEKVTTQSAESKSWLTTTQNSRVRSNHPREFLKRGRGSELIQVLITMIKGGRKTGKLIADNQRNIARSELIFQNSSLVHASSSLYSYRFGDLLVAKGLLTPNDLRNALEKQKTAPQKRLGEILVSQGLIDEDAIPNIVYHQIEFVLYELMTWEDIKYYFQKIDDIPQNEFVIHADYELIDGKLIHKHPSQDGDPKDLLSNADKNLSILQMIKQKLPNPKALVQRTNKTPEDTLSSAQKEVLDLATGANSIYDILMISNLDYFQTYTALFQVHGSGLIEVLASQKPDKSPTAAHDDDEDDEDELLADFNKNSVAAPTAQPGSTLPAAAQLADLQDQLQQYQHLEKSLGVDLVKQLNQIPMAKIGAFKSLLKDLLQLIK